MIRRRVAMVRVLRVCYLVLYRVLKVVEKFEKNPLLFRPVPLADEPLQVVSVLPGGAKGYWRLLSRRSGKRLRNRAHTRNRCRIHWPPRGILNNETDR